MPVAVNPASFGPRQAQPIEGFMSDAKSVLEGLFGETSTKDLPPMAQAAIEARSRIRSLAAQLFAPGSAGEELLEHLCDALMRRPRFVTQLGVDPMQALMFGAFREGQEAAIYYLLALIAEGRSEQAPQREGNDVQTVSVRKRPVRTTGGSGTRRRRTKP